MLDENLPTFFLKPNPDSVKYHETFFLTQHGSEPAATYSLHRLDPAAPASRSTYAAALFEAYNPAILYGEVLVKPGWTSPTLSQEEIRRNGGVPPAPQPITPDQFIIQLYNPDQQIMVKVKPGSWGGSPSYEFSMPQNTFRTPSASSLDRSQNDPGIDITTPKVNFVWKKEGKLSKDLTCFLTGKSTDPTGKKKVKEPDIAVALFAGLKEVTVYEPNLYRVDMEDPKGLEIVVLLSAAVIRDLYFGVLKDPFHVGESPRKNSAGMLGGRKMSSPTPAPGLGPQVPAAVPSKQKQPQQKQPAALGGLYNQPPTRPPADPRRPDIQQSSSAPPRLPARDPRQQWEIDAETARLKAQVDAENRQLSRKDEQRRREKQKEDEAETKRLKKMVEQEQKEHAKLEKERRRRQAEVDKETERLKKQYGNQANLFPPARPSHPFQLHQPAASTSQLPYRPQLMPIPQHRPASYHIPGPQARPQPRPQSRPQAGPYLMPPGSAGHASMMSLSSNGMPVKEQRRRSSFFNLRGESSAGGQRLAKKQSSIW